MNRPEPSPAAEEKTSPATHTLSELASANRPKMKIVGVISMALLLSGCAAIASMPLPLRIASNLHTALTVINNTDDDPDNDGLVGNYLTELPLQINDTDTTISNPAPITGL